MSDSFWTLIEAQLTELKTAATADDVCRILSFARNPQGEGDAGSTCHGFFAGSGGDGTVQDSLLCAGWSLVWAEASYYYVMRAPGGSLLTYIEGDVYKGDRRPVSAD